jgi:DNA replication protein DnaC
MGLRCGRVRASPLHNCSEAYTWAQLQWSRVPVQVARQLQSLREETILQQRENVLVFGKPACGKTHLLARARDPEQPTKTS